MLNRLQMLRPTSLLDIGVGSGTYGRLFRQYFPSAQTLGVEIWAPYIDQFGLNDLYDRVILDDVRTMPAWPLVDVVILGDVLEHMTVDEAREVWQLSRVVAKKAVYLSIPIVHYPQGPHEGNPYEEHVVDDWSHVRVLETFEGIGECHIGQTVGAYEALS